MGCLGWVSLLFFFTRNLGSSSPFNFIPGEEKKILVLFSVFHATLKTEREKKRGTLNKVSNKKTQKKLTLLRIGKTSEQLERMHNEYRRIPFPQEELPATFSSTIIYWQPRPRDEEIQAPQSIQV
jgi:hypothetical protein